jgi:hypothetical protein
MPEPFTLTAVPRISGEGEDEGHLEFVTFVASGNSTPASRDRSAALL